MLHATLLITTKLFYCLKLAVSYKNPSGKFAITTYFAFILSNGPKNERIDLNNTLDFSKNLEVHRTEWPGSHVCLQQMETNIQIKRHRVSSHADVAQSQ